MAKLIVFAAVVATILAGMATASSCYLYTGCRSCTESSSGDCGWNAESQTCQFGSASGPSGYSSPPAGWTWTEDQCCDTHTTCSGCTDAGSCGWNSYTGTCQYGTASGPSNNRYATGWKWDNSQCSASSNSDNSYACSWNFDCDDCIDTAGCGWDDVADMCYAGNSNGPYNGWTSDWKYYNCNTLWTWRFSAGSVSMWLTWAALVIFFSCCAGCLRARRRRAVIVATVATTNAPLVNNAQPVNYYTQQQTAPYPPPQQQGGLYGPSSYENPQCEGGNNMKV